MAKGSAGGGGAAMVARIVDTAADANATYGTIGYRYFLSVGAWW